MPPLSKLKGHNCLRLLPRSSIVHRKLALAYNLDSTYQHYSDSDSVSAIINSFGTLAKARPQLLQFIIEATSKWSPAKLTGQSAIKIRSAEKSIFILLNYLLKYVLHEYRGSGNPYTMALQVGCWTSVYHGYREGLGANF